MVSIVIVARDLEDKKLQKCIDSINAQTYKNIETHIMSGGSIVDARKRGVQLAVGEYICFIDSDQILPKDAKVIAPYGGDTSFLYQINRKGWPILEEPVDNMIKKGATNYVTVDPNDFTPGNVLAKYKIIKKTKDYLILDLLQNNQ